jgi:serine phosphatase RsbU (regulator of sigma subunit)
MSSRDDTEMRAGRSAEASAQSEPSGDASAQPAELAIARSQRHLLPASLPQIEGYEFAVVHYPRDESFGDF